MTWIPSYRSLGSHPKLRKLARLLGISPVQAVGHLHFLWWWAMDYAPDGDISRFDALDLAIGAEWPDDPAIFLDALVNSGFVDHDLDGAARLHDWDDYGGKLVAERMRRAEHMRQRRELTSRYRHVTVTLPSRDRHVTVKRRVDKIRGEERREPPLTPPSGDAVSGDAGASPPAEATHEAIPSNGTEPAAGAPVTEVQPFALLEALCEELGADVSALSRSERAKQLAVAKRLAEAGVTPDEIRREARWLQSQAWLTAGVDLFTVEKHRARWVLAGRPEAPKPRGHQAQPSYQEI